MRFLSWRSKNLIQPLLCDQPIEILKIPMKYTPSSCISQCRMVNRPGVSMPQKAEVCRDDLVVKHAYSLPCLVLPLVP